MLSKLVTSILCVAVGILVIDLNVKTKELLSSIK